MLMFNVKRNGCNNNSVTASLSTLLLAQNI